MISINSPFRQSKKIKQRSLFNIKKSAGLLMALTVNLFECKLNLLVLNVILYICMIVMIILPTIILFFFCGTQIFSKKIMSVNLNRDFCSFLRPSQPKMERERTTIIEYVSIAMRRGVLVITVS